MPKLEIISGGNNINLTAFKEKFRRLISEHQQEKAKFQQAYILGKPESEIKIIAARLNQAYRDMITAIREAYNENIDTWEDFEEYLATETALNISEDPEEEKNIYERRIKLNLKIIVDDIRSKIANTHGESKKEKTAYVKGAIHLIALGEDVEALKIYEDEAAIIEIYTKLIEAMPEISTNYLPMLLNILDQITAYGDPSINQLYGYRHEIWNQENYAQAIKKALIARLQQEEKITIDFEPILTYILPPLKYEKIRTIENPAEKATLLKQELTEGNVTTLATRTTEIVVDSGENVTQIATIIKKGKEGHERNIRQINLLLKGKVTNENTAPVPKEAATPLEFLEKENEHEKRLRKNAIEISKSQKKFLILVESGKEDAIHDMVRFTYRCYLICEGVYIAFYYNRNTAGEITDYYAFPRNIRPNL